MWAGTGAQDVCLQGPHHKAEPSPEKELFQECAPWEPRACCSAETSFSAHLDGSQLYNFSFSHCGLLPPACQRHFARAACFYECSPNLGPWVRKWGTGGWVPAPGGGQRVLAVPLCREDCEQWWQDCRTALTCRSHWHSGGWHWSRGRSRCPAGAPCRPFPAIFPTPALLCAGVWDGAFRASPELRTSGRCLRKWFQPGLANPNDDVAHRLTDPAGPRAAPPMPPAAMLPLVLSLLLWP
ncbi:sperm-egg fusion protein Juno [Sorex fumeus]|uniref:sperm-egg fusion protein Juno n=1 Tax=Sorex fumeus TaxID=62283 RepID=UPI0024AD85D5|nr:sperm-egg fusion protein Juno [Sorex fumeus]